MYPLDKPIPSYQLTALVLRDRILRGEYRGTLPAERYLGPALGVDRVTLRGALQELESSGLITREVGRGTRILVEGKPLPELARELLRVRRHLAGAVLARLAEVRPDPAPIAAAVEAFGEAARTRTRVISADLAVLEALVAATDSPVYPMALAPIRQTLRAFGPLAHAMYQDPEGNHEGWKLLVQWLEDPDPESIPVILTVLEQRDAVTLAAL